MFISRQWSKPSFLNSLSQVEFRLSQTIFKIWLSRLSKMLSADALELVLTARLSSQNRNKTSSTWVASIRRNTRQPPPVVAPEHPHDGYLSVRPPTGLPADGIEGEGWEPPGHRPQNTAAAFSARLMAGVHFNGGSVSAGYDPINNPVNIDSLIEAFPVLHPGLRIGVMLLWMIMGFSLVVV